MRRLATKFTTRVNSLFCYRFIPDCDEMSNLMCGGDDTPSACLPGSRSRFGGEDTPSSCLPGSTSRSHSTVSNSRMFYLYDNKEMYICLSKIQTPE